MYKVWAVAIREYRAAVQTKAFIISLVLMPVLWGVSIGIQVLMRKAEDQTTKKYAIVDRTGQLKSALDVALARHNTVEIFDRETKERIAPVYELIYVDPSPNDKDAIEHQRLELSQRLQKAEFEGFLEIGPAVFEIVGPETPKEARRSFRYQSDKAGSRDFSRWATRALNNAVQEKRFAATGVSQDLVRQIQSPVTLDVKGLTKRNPATGAIEDVTDESRIVSFVLPAVLIALMFMMVLIGSMPAMQGVVEEKQQRIAEVLLGSVTPFQLMLGKLMGVVAVSLTVSAVYLGGGYAVAARYGMTDSLTPDIIGWFIVFLVLAVLMYGSLFMAVGAAAGDMKETQALQMPIMIVATLPMLLLGAVIQDPGGTVAVIGSFIPFSSPMLMMARLSSPQSAPWWHAAVAAVGVLITSLACVWAAGRIFRVGLLMQGKGVKFTDLAKWVVSG